MNMTFCTQKKVSSLNNRTNRKLCASYIESKLNQKLANVSLINARYAEGLGTAKFEKSTNIFLVHICLL